MVLAPGDVDAARSPRLEAGRPLHPLPGPRHIPRRARKDWIAASLGAMGVIRIDAGAARALRRGSSLLPAGVIAVEGSFERGDAVLVRGPDGTRSGQGPVRLRRRRRRA